MAEFDDSRVRVAMRSYLDACDALDEAAGHSESESSSRDFIDRAEAKTLAEMVLRQQLERLGWSSPREAAPVDDRD